MGTLAAVGIYDNLASRQPGVTVRTTDYELARGVDVVCDTVVEQCLSLIHISEVVGLFKAFADGFRVFRGNAGTVIGDGEGDVSGMLCEGAVQADFALCGVFLCIGKEVAFS